MSEPQSNTDARPACFRQATFDNGEVFLEQVNRTTGYREPLPWPADWPKWVTSDFVRLCGFSVVVC